MSDPPLSTTLPLVVQDPERLKDLFGRLKKQRRLAMDTEAASYHRYFDRIYLIQVSSKEESAIIDPVAIPNIKPLGQILSNKAVEIVFHDADYDLRVLDRDFGFSARSIFDTRVAAQLLGEPGIGLGALLQKYFGITLDKRMQRADWSQRPLTPDMIRYAAADTSHLLALRDALEAKLRAQDRLDWATEEFTRLETVKWTPTDDQEAYLRIKRAKALRPRARTVLKSLFEWRDATARALDRAPFRVLGNEAMLAIARVAPTSQASIAEIRGVGRSTLHRYGDEIIRACRAGSKAKIEKLTGQKPTRRPRLSNAAEHRVTRLKSLRDSRARELELEAGVLCPNGTLQAIVLSEPPNEKALLDVDELRNWQITALGPERILRALNGSTGAAGRPPGERVSARETP